MEEESLRRDLEDEIRILQEQRDERIYELFPRLKERPRQQARTLSGGEQQMLAVGRALMARPRLLMLDEPTTGLAPKIAQLAFEALEGLKKEGMTLLIAEQQVPLALSVADRGYVLENGRIRLSGPDPERRSYRSYASFRDPDGNGWLLQEVTARLPGRVAAGATTFASSTELAAALRRAAAAHGEHEARTGGQRDENWPDWYAEYVVAEQSGKEAPA